MLLFFPLHNAFLSSEASSEGGRSMHDRKGLGLRVGAGGVIIKDQDATPNTFSEGEEHRKAVCGKTACTV